MYPVFNKNGFFTHQLKKIIKILQERRADSELKTGRDFSVHPANNKTKNTCEQKTRNNQKKEDILDFLRNNKSDLATAYHVRNIGIIGSYARGEQDEKSDIDFIIEFNDTVEDIFEAKFQLRQFLQSNLKRNVDICRKKYLKPFVKDSILKEAIYG